MKFKHLLILTLALLLESSEASHITFDRLDVKSQRSEQVIETTTTLEAFRDSLSALARQKCTATNIKDQKPAAVWDHFLAMVELPSGLPKSALKSFFLIHLFEKPVGCGFFFSSSLSTTNCTLYLSQFKSFQLLKDILEHFLRFVPTGKAEFVFLPEIQSINRDTGHLQFGCSEQARHLQKALRDLGFSCSEKSMVLTYEKTLKKSDRT